KKEMARPGASGRASFGAGVPDCYPGPLVIRSFLEQVDRVRGVRRQANRVAIDRSDKTSRQIMMPAVAAVGAGQLDPLAVEMIDGTDMDAVGADDMHMFLDRAMVVIGHGLSPCRAAVRSAATMEVIRARPASAPPAPTNR